MLLFPIRTTTFFFLFLPEKQREQLDANLKINILYLDRYIDDSFQEHQSQYCWELSPDLFQPKKKIEHYLQRTLVGSIFPTLGLRRVLQYIFSGMSKIIAFFFFFNGAICFGARVMFLLQEAYYFSTLYGCSKSTSQVCQKALLRIPQRHMFN